MRHISIKAIISYLYHSRTHLYVHSPFVYGFCESVLYNNHSYYAFDQIEQLRHQLLINTTIISGPDPGAGSSRSGPKTIANVARFAATPPKWGRLLFKTVLYMQPMHILELGTSLGIGTAYLAAPLPHTKFTGIEGNPQLADLARKHAASMGLYNVHIINGLFEAVLQQPDALTTPPDLIFIDGHHTFEATCALFDKLLPLCSSNALFIFDDILWSAGMVQAWATIIKHPLVTTTMHLGKMGFVFINPAYPRQNFTFRY
jgi:predicted O-methyltransferase YrrM